MKNIPFFFTKAKTNLPADCFSTLDRSQRYHSDTRILFCLDKLSIKRQYSCDLRGVAQVGRKKKHKIIRPLLDLKRESITTICQNFKIPVYPDKSNRSIQYSRNRIRKQILPSMKCFLNPQVENSLFKVAELLNREQDFLYSLLKNS